MEKCRIKKSQVWNEGSIDLTVQEHNKRAWLAGYNFFAYGQVIFEAWYPESFNAIACATKWFKKDLVDE
jgi:hypothetical protein